MRIRPAMAVLLLAVSTLSCAKYHGVVVLDEGFVYRHEGDRRELGPWNTDCSKRFLTPLMQVPRGERVRYVVVNSCDLPYQCGETSTLAARNWRYTKRIVKDPSEWDEAEATPSEPPFGSGCHFTREKGAKDVPAQKRVDLTCNVREDVAQGSYRFDFVFQCGDRTDNWDPIIVIFP